MYLGNGLIAIVCGLAANFLVETIGAGFVSPFDASSLVLLAGAALIWSTWPENYGDGRDQAGLFQQLRSAMWLIGADRRIALLGAMQGLYEGTMYTFIFLWTPALSPNDEHIPHGLVFASFMVACMAGSALSGILMCHGLRPEKYMQAVFLVASVSLAVPLCVHSYSRSVNGGHVRGGMSLEARTQMVAFCVFEATIGLFWPSLMKMRSQYVPEEKLSTVINCFRMPVNAFVCVILFNISHMNIDTVFAMCSFFLAVCAVLQWRLHRFLASELFLPRTVASKMRPESGAKACQGRAAAGDRVLLGESLHGQPPTHDAFARRPSAATQD